MTLPRSTYVREGEIAVYHCFNRCVRRARLCGFDPVTGRDFSHRKTWVVDRLRFLASVFAIDVCSFAVMDTHLHEVLRTRPDIAAAWSDREVAIRWLTLYPKKKKKIPLELQISALTDSPSTIAELRQRLSSLSWFEARLNEHIARLANKEDGVTGKFWESRFKGDILLDDASIVAGMVYVDLNLIRARLACTPEDSDFTSIQQRILNWRREMMPQDSIPSDPSHNTPSPSADSLIQNPEENTNCLASVPESTLPILPNASSWLCPIQSTSHRCGILQMTETDYFDLVDRSGRILHSDKSGAIDPHLDPILLRIGVNPLAWHDTISHFGTRFRLAAGKISSMRAFAQRLGKRWFIGLSAAQAAFSN